MYMKHYNKAFICVILFVFSACTLLPLPTLNESIIPEGYIGEEEHFDKEGWQDFTDYCKYVYTDATTFETNLQFQIVTDSDTENIVGYFENFQTWMETENRLGEYDFDTGCITPGDYVHIETKEGTPIGTSGSKYDKFDSYTVYFFDTDSNTLYYIHNNI